MYYKIKCEVDLANYTLALYESYWPTRLSVIKEEKSDERMYPSYPKFIYGLDRESASHEGVDSNGEDVITSLDEWLYMYQSFQVRLKDFPKDYIHPGAYFYECFL